MARTRYRQGRRVVSGLGKRPAKPALLKVLLLLGVVVVAMSAWHLFWGGASAQPPVLLYMTSVAASAGWFVVASAWMLCRACISRLGSLLSWAATWAITWAFNSFWWLLTLGTTALACWGAALSLKNGVDRRRLYSWLRRFRLVVCNVPACLTVVGMYARLPAAASGCFSWAQWAIIAIGLLTLVTLKSLQHRIDERAAVRAQGQLLALANKRSGVYQQHMQPLLVRPVGDLTLAHARPSGSTTFNSNGAIMKQLRELRDMLPLHAAASIFVRYDKRKPGRMSACVVGPPGTPYAGGLYMFDVDAQYFPEVPYVNITSTDGGRVRWNPNLYKNGKVCLSLLGTWGGAGPETRWQKGKSTLLQVLVSIQSLILGVKYPYFNEPGRGLPPPDSAPQTDVRPQVFLDSNGGVNPLQLDTMRVAMIQMMKKPPAIWADVVHRHFALRQEYVRGVVAGWIKDATSESHRTALQQLLPQLEAALDDLPPLPALPAPDSSCQAAVTGATPAAALHETPAPDASSMDKQAARARRAAVLARARARNKTLLQE